MTAIEKRPACQVGMHHLCHGTTAVRVAPYKVPAVTFRCDCSCHRGGRRPRQ